MVEGDKYCIDILAGLSRHQGAQAVAPGLLKEHLDHCEAIAEGGETADRKLREDNAAIARLVRS